MFSAQVRTRVGKGAARAARREGLVPAVIYGAGKDPLPIAIDPRVLRTEINKPGFFSTLYDIQYDGQSQQVLCRDLQLHPVTDAPLHADFLRVTEQTLIDVEIAVHFENEEESPGLKLGGVLNIVRHTVELNCRAGAIPEMIVVDLTGREIGDSIHISEIALPAGVRPTITDRDFTIATIAAPSVLAAEEEAGAAVEGEEGVAGAAEAGAEEAGGEGEEE